MNNKIKELVSFAFLGDIALNDDYIEMYNKKEKPFNYIGSLLNNFDYIIGNLECMAEGDSGENEFKKPRLKTTVETLNFLNDISLRCALLAHNHIYDNLKDGYLKTTAFLNENNIEYFGAGTSQKEAEKVHIVDINGVRICLLNYVTSDTNPKLPLDSEVYLNEFNTEKIINDIQKYREKVNHIVLLLHWGGEHEGGYYPDFYQPDLAKIFIDNGANLIVGNHSHTFQPYEIYKGKHIFYSLGNFCFSDAHKFGYEINQDRGTKSIILDVKFSKTSYCIDMIPIKNNSGHIETDKSILIEHKSRQSIFHIMQKIKPLWIIYHYYHKYLFPVYYYFFGNDRQLIDRLKNLKFEKIKYYFLRK